MPYTPIQDGTQAFAIPASPVTINSVTYIAEDINITNPTKIVEISDSNDVPTGQTLIPKNPTLTMKLQLATLATVVPPKGGTFTAFGATWYVTDVGTVYTQGDYVKVNVSAVKQINP